MTQLVLSPELKLRVVHGGELSVGKRKTARPIATNRAMHVIIRSSHAKGQWSFRSRRNAPAIKALVSRFARQFGVRFYHWSINSNHLHFAIRPSTRAGLTGFLSALSGGVSQVVTGARKGKALGFRFFDHIPFTRIVEWGRAFKNLLAYVQLNVDEAAGRVPYRPRGKAKPPKLSAALRRVPPFRA